MIVDLAGEAGGNCELSEPGRTVIETGVKVIARSTSRARWRPASQLYSKNVENLLGLLVDDEGLALDFEDEIVAGACITREGEIVVKGQR